MSDEKNGVPETLDTIGQKIAGLAKSIDARFAQVDARFAQVDARFAQVDARFEQVDARFEQVDARFTMFEKSMATQFAELKAHLSVKIEALDTKINLVYDTVIAQTAKNTSNDTAHEPFDKRLDDHDTRILALENPEPPTSVA